MTDLRSGISPRIYLAAQSACIVLWRILLSTHPSVRERFAPDIIGGIRWLLWFLPADVVTVGGGVLAAIAWRSYAGRLGVVLALIGISTQTLACFSVPLQTGGHDGWLGIGMMLSASIATLASASVMLIETQAGASLFKAAPESWTRRQIARRTILQSAVLWPLFLVVLPWVLSRLERSAGWQPPSSTLALSLRLSLGVVLFITAGLVNIATARAMIDHGGGTPLPVCMATRLVTTGPYAYLRNPMCVSALVQGIAVSILLASPLTASYVVLGGIIWQVFIRPTEERDLGERFGRSMNGTDQECAAGFPDGGWASKPRCKTLIRRSSDETDG